jgi:uncharacterized protein YpmS
MMKIKNKKVMTILAALVVCVIVICGIFFSMLFYNSSYSAKEVKVSSTLVDRVRAAQLSGGKLELSKEDLNQIVSMYLKKGQTMGEITVKGVSVDILKNHDLEVLIPIQYKGINVLLSSEGSLYYKNNNVEYSPLYFKVGKISLPKNFVLNKLVSKLKDKITIDNGTVVINKSIIPVQVSSLVVGTDKISMNIEKNAALAAAENKLKSITSTMKDINNAVNITGAAKGASTANSTASAQENAMQGKNTSTAASQGTAVSGTQKTSQQISQMDAALSRINGGLNAAMGSVSTGGQQAVLSAMEAAISSMKGNPSANPYAYAGGVRAQYEKLPLAQKAQLKAAIFSNVNGSDISIVSKMLSP